MSGADVATGASMMDATAATPARQVFTIERPYYHLAQILNG